MALHRVVVGTAGHIDHGKTTLVQALTGIDCDRWQEEKDRGITIDLGFAHLTVPLPVAGAAGGEADGTDAAGTDPGAPDAGAPDPGGPDTAADRLQVGFVDVPGHERFLHNALAGLGGIRVLLLVVAADEGVKPQTREHLDIASLLEIPAAVVALTKTDAVEADLVELARLEVEELLETTPFAGAPIAAVSSRTGDGLEELRATLLALAASQTLVADRQAPARLPLDRAFVLKGLGVVATGTLAQGAVAPGDRLEILPSPGDRQAGSPRSGGPVARVRGVQVHGEDRDEALAGERVALQLAGVELDQLSRGLQAAAPDAFDTTDRLLARVRLLPDAPKAIRGFTPVRLHLLSSEVMAKLRPLATRELAPGGWTTVEIRLAEPVVALAGDRIILRRPSPETTLGGGVVLDPAPRRRRKGDLDEVAGALAGIDLAGSRSAGPLADRAIDRLLVHWVSEALAAGADAATLARRLGEAPERTAERLSRLTGSGELLEVPETSGRPARWVRPALVRDLAERARRLLADHFARDRLSLGIPKAEAVQRLFPGASRSGTGGASSPDLTEVYLSWLEARGVLTVDGGRVTAPDRRARLTDEESGLAKDLLERFEAAGLTPTSPAEIGRSAGAKPQIVDGMVRYLVDRGKLVRLPGGLILAASSLDRLARDLEATGWERFSVPQFKDRFGLSRKWAIPLLEHLDSRGATRRVGDERLVVRTPAPVP